MNTTNEPAGIDLDKPDTLAALLCCLYEGPEIQRAATMLIDQAMQIEELTLARRAPAPVVDERSLPPKPHTTYNGYSDGSEPLWTAAQMEDYARAALAQQSPAPVVAHDVPEARASQPEGATGTTGASQSISPDELAGMIPQGAIIQQDGDVRRVCMTCAELKQFAQLAAKGQGSFIEVKPGETCPCGQSREWCIANECCDAAPASAQPDRGAAQDDNGFRKALEEIAAMRGKGDCASDLIDIADSALAGLYAASPASQPVAPEVAQADDKERLHAIKEMCFWVSLIQEGKRIGTLHHGNLTRTMNNVMTAFNLPQEGDDAK
jgi:hypothetical protein